jgi:hypothetical protein
MVESSEISEILLSAHDAARSPTCSRRVIACMMDVSRTTGVERQPCSQITPACVRNANCVPLQIPFTCFWRRRNACLVSPPALSHAHIQEMLHDMRPLNDIDKHMGSEQIDPID